MASLDTALAATRAAVGELIAAAERAGGTWTEPVAPGKWSPSQVVEHVARAMEESANVVSGAPSKFPKFPFFLRPVARGLVFNRILKQGKFFKARTSRAFNPLKGPPTPAAGRERLEQALATFDQASRARAAAGERVESSIFGAVPVEDYVRFQELHTRHHCKQMSAAP